MIRSFKSIEELNRLCQKPDYKKVGNWMVRYFERDAAIYITRLLLCTSITANQVTFLAIAVALLGGFLMATGNALLFLIGTLLLQLWYLLDHVDGQIARYHGTTSPDGVFFDFMMHHIVNFIPLFALGCTGYFLTGNVWAIICGYLASVSVECLTLLNDCSARAIYACVKGSYRSDAILNMKAAKTVSKKMGIAGFAAFFLHKACEIHVLMNVLTVFGVFFTVFFEARPGWVVSAVWSLLLFYAAAATTLWAAKLYRLITTRDISRKYSDFTLMVKAVSVTLPIEK